MGRKTKLIAVSSILPGAFIVLSAFSGSAFAKQSDASFDAADGELIVSVDEDSEINAMQDTDNAIRNSSELEQDGFDVSDSLLQSDNMETMSDDFKHEVVDHMGMVYLVEYSESQYDDMNEAKEELENSLESMDMEVRYVEENDTVHALDDNAAADMDPDQEWNYEMINAPDAWDTTPGADSTDIAVLDTGIDDSHQNLSDFVDTSAGKSFVGDDTDDGEGHGTHVSGTVASYGDVSGVMQEANLIPVKVLDDDGSGSVYDIQEGITYAAEEDADVINMSLGGGGENQGMEEAIETANDEGTIVVVASGNEGQGNVSYPAAYDDAVAVGSVDSDESRSDFSNYGEELDIMAPGADIYSTVPGDDYETMSGTSMASPHVAGVMGLIRSAVPEISVDEAKRILNDTAQDAGSENEYGNGIVDADAAVQEAKDGDGGDDPEDPDDPDDPDNPDNPEAPDWEAYTNYEYDDEVTYDGQEYVCDISHYSTPGTEPSSFSFYWSEK